jgi:putative transposase
MCGKGNCYDNSAVESVFKSLRVELIWRRNGKTRQDVEVTFCEYINSFDTPPPQTLGHRLEIARGLRTEGHLTCATDSNKWMQV